MLHLIKLSYNYVILIAHEDCLANSPHVSHGSSQRKGKRRGEDGQAVRLGGPAVPAGGDGHQPLPARLPGEGPGDHPDHAHREELRGWVRRPARAPRGPRARKGFASLLCAISQCTQRWCKVMMEPKRAREGIASSFTNRDTRPAEAARFPAGRWWVAAGPCLAREALGRGGGRPPGHPGIPRPAGRGAPHGGHPPGVTPLSPRGALTGVSRQP